MRNISSKSFWSLILFHNWSRQKATHVASDLPDVSVRDVVRRPRHSELLL